MISRLVAFPRSYLLAIPFCLLPVVAISSASIWIDEGITAYLASQVSVLQMFKEIFTRNGSETQMPGYMIYMWGWIKLFGVNEVSLRLSNLPFLLLFFFSILFLPKKSVYKIAAILLICLSPMVIYYMNEARSSIALFSFSGISLCGIILYNEGSGRQVGIGRIVTILSIIVGCCFNLLGFFVIPALVAVLLLNHGVWRSRPSRVYQIIKPVVVATAFLLPLCAYYLWTFAMGAGGMRERPTLLNIGYALYEFVGFAGVGPPRNDLRQSLSFSTFGHYLVPMTILGAVILGLVCTLILERRRAPVVRECSGKSVFMGFGVGLSVFCLLSFVVSFRFWGRHLLFIYPFLILFVSGLLVDVLDDVASKHRSLKVLLCCLTGLWLYSDFNLRCVEAYQKDNYKLAVRSAVEMGGSKSTVLWAGNDVTALYYGLDFLDLKRPEGWAAIQNATSVQNRSSSEIEEIIRQNHQAVLVMFAKADLFDSKHAWRDYISLHNLRCLFSARDFSIYAL